MRKVILIVLLIAAVVSSGGCNFTKPAPKPEGYRVAEGVTIDGVAVEKLTSEEVNGLLNKWAEEKYQAPVNAKFDDETAQISFEKRGRRMNIPATAEQIMSAPANSHISAVFQDVMPEISAEQLRKAKNIGSYTSPILNDQPGRMTNIKLTAKLINNNFIEAGQEFSFNRVTGEPTAERGFQNATVFIGNGRQEDGIGGGMCQVSSTLYNAVLQAGLPVTERHPHSQPVNYVPVNRDATTFTDKDLRFINNTRHTVIIRSFTQKKYLIVDLWALQ